MKALFFQDLMICSLKHAHTNAFKLNLSSLMRETLRLSGNPAHISGNFPFLVLLNVFLGTASIINNTYTVLYYSKYLLVESLDLLLAVKKASLSTCKPPG